MAAYHHQLVAGPFADVVEFHEKFGIEYRGKPRALPKDLLDFRRLHMGEELGEYEYNAMCLEKAIDDEDDAEVTKLLEGCLDALVDLVYVALGTAHMHGFNFDEAWRRVQKANMTKVRVERAEDSKRGSLYDVVKPPDFVPPSHSDLVEDHAHRVEPL